MAQAASWADESSVGWSTSSIRCAYWPAVANAALARGECAHLACGDLLGHLVGQHRRLGGKGGVEEDLADKLVRVDYIVSFDRQPLRFEFQFYNSNGAWMTYAFKFQDDLGDWLDEKVRTKYYYSFDN